jgi:ParB/RepB/Spo0J family partition protein
MKNKITSIELAQLIAHPDDPNKMSKLNFSKLVNCIKQTKRYEPLIVRPAPDAPGLFQLINGHNRCRALAQLGKKNADCIVWNIDDAQTDLFLATLNRLGGFDRLEKKLNLLKRLSKKFTTPQLAKLLPYSPKQIDRLLNLKKSSPQPAPNTSKNNLKEPLVFFLSQNQYKIIAHALSNAINTKSSTINAAKNAQALTKIAQNFLSV